MAVPAARNLSRAAECADDPPDAVPMLGPNPSASTLPIP
jgi:hypothetical protein